MIEEVSLSAIKYKVVKTNETILSGGQECGGEVDYNTCEILISERKIANDRVPFVLMHEIVHAMLFERGFEEENDNEKLVSGIATGIIDFIRNNDEAVRYIQDKKPA